MQLVTLYVTGGFGVSRIEGKLIEHGRKKHAQYDAAAYVHILPKGKRKPIGYITGYKPSFLILAGHGHPEPDTGFVEKDIGDTGMVCKASRYASFDPRYQSEFDAMIAAYLADKPGIVVADYREGGAS